MFVKDFFWKQNYVWKKLHNGKSANGKIYGQFSEYPQTLSWEIDAGFFTSVEIYEVYNNSNLYPANVV